MIATDQIAKVLGLPTSIRSLGELAAAVAAGLPKAALRACVEHVSTTPTERRKLLYRVVPEATYKRRRGQLKPEESARTERLARVIATAEYVWNDAEDARRFLNTPHPELASATPIERALTELGARQVEELLWKIFYGLPI